jgi:serine protease Do
MKRKWVVGSLFTAGIVTAIAAGGVGYYAPVFPHARASAPAVLNAAPDALQALPDFSRLVKHYGPAVVNISVTHTVKAGAAPDPWGRGEDDPIY